MEIIDEWTEQYIEEINRKVKAFLFWDRAKRQRETKRLRKKRRHKY